MSLRTSLSVRHINALRQLSKYHRNADHVGPVTHVLTGARISPVGELNDEEDSCGILTVEFSDGHVIEVNTFAFFQIALKEAAEIEVSMHLKTLASRKASRLRYSVASLILATICDLNVR